MPTVSWVLPPLLPCRWLSCGAAAACTYVVGLSTICLGWGASPLMALRASFVTANGVNAKSMSPANDQPAVFGCLYDVLQADDQYSGAELRQRYSKGGSLPDSSLSASQLRARHGVPSNKHGAWWCRCRDFCYCPPRGNRASLRVVLKARCCLLLPGIHSSMLSPHFRMCEVRH